MTDRKRGTRRRPSPFERLDLDPLEGPRAITERVRELALDATTDEERAELRAIWEELTMHPGPRVRAALAAHPETRVPLGAPPPPPAPVEGREPPPASDLRASDLAVAPSIAAALTRSEVEPEGRLADDPALGERR